MLWPFRFLQTWPVLEAQMPNKSGYKRGIELLIGSQTLCGLGCQAKLVVAKTLPWRVTRGRLIPLAQDQGWPSACLLLEARKGSCCCFLFFLLTFFCHWLPLPPFLCIFASRDKLEVSVKAPAFSLQLAALLLLQLPSNQLWTVPGSEVQKRQRRKIRWYQQKSWGSSREQAMRKPLRRSVGACTLSSDMFAQPVFPNAPPLSLHLEGKWAVRLQSYVLIPKSQLYWK